MSVEPAKLGIFSPTPKEERKPDPGLTPFNIFFGELNWLYFNVAGKIAETVRKASTNGWLETAIEIKLTSYRDDVAKPYDFKLYFLRNKSNTPGLRIEVSLADNISRFTAHQKSRIAKYEIALVDHKTGERSKYKKFEIKSKKPYGKEKASIDFFLSECKESIQLRTEKELECRKAKDFENEYSGYSFAFSPVIRHSRSKIFIQCPDKT